MAALVQSYPQQSGSVTMLQSRPTSSPGILPHPQSQANQHYNRADRNNYHGFPTGQAASGPYRGSTGPIHPYAFANTPMLNHSAQWQQFGAFRTSSSPSVPTMQTFDINYNLGQNRYPTGASVTNLATNPLMLPQGSRDDSSLPGMNRRSSPAPRPQSSYLPSTSQPPLSPAGASRVSPERYRRPAVRPVDVQAPGQRGNPPVRPQSYYSSDSRPADDLHVYRHHSADEVKRFRRRSMPALDSADYPQPLTPHDFKRPEGPSRLEQLSLPKPADKEQSPSQSAAANNPVAPTLHARSGSSDSTVSNRSTRSRPSSSANRNTNASAPTGNPALFPSVSDHNAAVNQDYPRLVNIPPRSSSSDAAIKRAANPSPLSKPVTMGTELAAVGATAASREAGSASNSRPGTSSAADSETPAVRQLAAINAKGGKPKSKTSRLRRALSFGSAADFQKTVNPPEKETASAPPIQAKLHKDPTADELYDAEQARIAQQQEEGGIGNNIYAGARIFAGSSDNLSISSTASSASIMIRKMGRSMKKSTRSLVGLFRPKSVVGVPPPSAALPDAGQAAVSMITVEAERERVNVNPDPHSQFAGGTGFPRLERNSVEVSQPPSTASDRLGSSGTDNSARKSIVGGEKERAEVLAAVRKGILKNSSGSSSPSTRPADVKGAAFDLPVVPQFIDSPNSSAPSTPNDEVQGHKRTSSVAIGNEDYFMTALRLRQDTKSAPGTPSGSAKRSATFSPRLVFHDTWPSQEYDRRGDIATCNRLTPMLAQQIKEELNSFKMEMEVHENSKIYTHFF